MSFEGLGGLIGALVLISAAGPVLLAGAAALVAGGATYLAVRAGAAAVRALYGAYAGRQSARHERVSRELEQIQGSMGEAARRQERRVQELIDQGNQAYQKAVQARQRHLDELQERLENMKDPAQADQLLQAELKESEKAVDAVIEREVTRFQDDLRQSCQAESAALSRRIQEDSAAFSREVAKAEAMLDERQERYRVYAESLSREGDKLLSVLKAQYDWQRFAPEETERIARLSQEITGLLKDGKPDAAAALAADFEDELLALQSELAWKTAVSEHQKLCVDTALAELKAVREASKRFSEDTEQLTGQGKLLEGYVTEEMGIAFWSEDRMTGLFERAGALEEEAADYEQHSVTVLTGKLLRLTEEIRREHARARAFLANRAAVLKAAEAVLESMEENGWTLAEDAGYQDGDPRNDWEMVFENEEGDRRTMTVCTEFDETEGRYMVWIERQSFERGLPDEDMRQAEDAALNSSLEKRGLGGMGVTCNPDTRGMSRPAGA